MDSVGRLWDALVAVTGPYGAVAVVAFVIMLVIAWLLSRP